MLKKENNSIETKDKCENFIEEFDRLGPEYGMQKVMSIWSILSVQEFIIKKTRRNNVEKLESIDDDDDDDDDDRESVTMKSNKTNSDNMYSDNPAVHFLKSFDRIMSQHYEPNLDDILNLRSPTSGKNNNMYFYKMWLKSS